MECGTNYKVGDLVRIRDWNDLSAEYGTDGDDIPCPFTFVHEMRHFCGHQYIISDIYIEPSYFGGSTKKVQKLGFEDPDGIEEFSVSGQMVEYVLDETVPDDFVTPDICDLF